MSLQTKEYFFKKDGQCRVISLEVTCFSKIFLEKDYLIMENIRQLLRQIQIDLPFNCVTPIGEKSNLLVKPLISIDNETIEEKKELYVIDRTVDMSSLFKTESYLGYANNYGNMLGKKNVTSYYFNEKIVSFETEFGLEIGIEKLSDIRSFLKNKCDKIKEIEKTDRSNYSVKKLSEFTKQLPNLLNEKKEIAAHLDILHKICELTKELETQNFDMILEDIYKNKPLVYILINIIDFFIGLQLKTPEQIKEELPDDIISKILCTGISNFGNNIIAETKFMFKSIDEIKMLLLNEIMEEIISQFGFHYFSGLQNFKKLIELMIKNKQETINQLKIDNPYIIMYLGGCTIDEIYQINKMYPDCIIITTKIMSPIELINEIFYVKE